MPYFLGKNYGLRGDDAGYVSTLFDLFGIAGCIAAGYLSDRYFNGRRARISFFFLVAMGASCVLMYTLGQVTMTLFALSIALVGFTLYGPDALMTGAAAQDIGGRGTALAAGIINGLGSVGAVVQSSSSRGCMTPAAVTLDRLWSARRRLAGRGGVRGCLMAKPEGAERRMTGSFPTQARCVVIGGGSSGLVAYHLGRMGWTDTVVLERGRLTCGSTFHAAGLVGQLRSRRTSPAPQIQRGAL